MRSTRGAAAEPWAINVDKKHYHALRELFRDE
jgi:hypothetical protein